MGVFIGDVYCVSDITHVFKAWVMSNNCELFNVLY